MPSEREMGINPMYNAAKAVNSLTAIIFGFSIAFVVMVVMLVQANKVHEHKPDIPRVVCQ